MIITWGPVAVAAGWGITIIAGAQLTRGAAWIQRQASAHLPGNWPLLVPALFIALTASFIVVLMIGFHPREKPDRSAEFMAIAVVVLILLVGGSLRQHFPALGG